MIDKEFAMNIQSAFLTHAQPAGLLTAFRIKLGELRSRRQQASAQRQEIARITHELSAYSDRQLADLGFSRVDIPDVAHGRFGQA